MTREEAVQSTGRLPKIAFLPCFKNYGETYPLIAMARKYRERGGEAIFVGFPGEYDRYARDLGFRLVELVRPPPQESFQEYKRLMGKFQENQVPQEKLYPFFFSNGFEGEDRIRQEIDIFRREQVDAVVSSFNFTPLISARAAHLPLVTVLSGVATASFFEANRATFPDGFENSLTRLVPRPIKTWLTNQYILRLKWGVKWCNELAEKYHTPHVRRFLDLFRGDETLVLDDLDFVDLQPASLAAHEHFIGPIIPEDSTVADAAMDPDIQAMFDAPGRTVLVALGTSVIKKIFLDVVTTLGGTDYKILASYKNLVTEEELPPPRPNVLLRKFFPSIRQLQERADVSIITGGRGAVYTAALSGRPVVGIPIQSEQQWNLDNLMRHGVGIQLSKKFFAGKKLTKAIDTIFRDYDTYLENAKRLKARMQQSDAPTLAAQRILAISQSHAYPT